MTLSLGKVSTCKRFSLLVQFMFPFFGSITNADALGNYGCGNKDKRTHVNCLRGLLASTPYGLTVQQSSPSKDGLGNYGCGNANKSKHTTCLRRILDEHGAHLQVGNNGGGEHHDPNMPPLGGVSHSQNSGACSSEDIADDGVCNQSAP
jgi:hypothetical protein